jgi:hypothetical protein
MREPSDELVTELIAAIRAGDQDEMRRLLESIGETHCVLIDTYSVPHLYIGVDGSKAFPPMPDEADG